MPLLAISWGCAAMLLTAMAWIPGMQWVSWITIPFGAIGALLGFIAAATERSPKRQRAITGLSLSALALVSGLLCVATAG